MKKLRENKKGFTLIEMIVVIVIIAILAAIAVPAVMKYIDEARDTKLITHASSAKTSLEAELAKYQAKSKDGVFDEAASNTNLTAAIGNVKKDVTDVDDIKVCAAVSIKTETPASGSSTEKAECTALTTKKISEIKGYVVTFTGGETKAVVIENDGAAEIAPDGVK